MARLTCGWKGASLLLLLVAIAGICAIAVRDAFREPSYAGKPLRYWVDQLPARLVFTNAYSEAFPGFFATPAEAEAAQEGQVERAKQAKTAVKALGAQCLPLLLGRLNTKPDSAIKNWLLRWGYRLKLLKPAMKSPDVIRGQAVTGLLELGDEARPAVPRLLVLVRSGAPEVSVSARHVLERLAPDELHRLSSP